VGCTHAGCTKWTEAPHLAGAPSEKLHQMTFGTKSYNSLFFGQLQACSGTHNGNKVQASDASLAATAIAAQSAPRQGDYIDHNQRNLKERRTNATLIDELPVEPRDER
jgi:hypothetical protein